ncbi:MAG: Uma2 family endonuclease [Hyphomicrobiaceae bacterium]
MPQVNVAYDLMTVEDYLAAENDGSWRHEFIDGMVYAMAGASERHSVIKVNVIGLLNVMIAQECRVFDGDMKLRITQEETTRFFYPDVFVSCTPPDDTQYFREDASLIIEVLSPSTQRIDRYEKMPVYKALPSLSEYVLVEQDFPKIEIFRRRTGWRREVLEPDDPITLESIGQTLNFNQVYRRIDFVNPGS